MSDIKVAKQKTEGRSLNVSPRRDNKPQMRKLSERDQYIKPRLTDNEQFNPQTATLYGQLQRQHTALDLLRQSTNVSTVKRRANRKQIQLSPSQKLNQLLQGKLSLSENKIKDTELSLKKLEDLQSETEQKLGSITGEKLSFIDNLRKLLDSYDDNKSKMEEQINRNTVLSTTITELNDRIVQNSDFYRKEQVKFKNQIDTKEIENQKLLDNIEKLAAEKAALLERVDKLEGDLNHLAKPPKAICRECKTEIQNSTLSTNSINQEKTYYHLKSSHSRTLDRCQSAESSARHHRVRKLIKSDSEIHNTSELTNNSLRPLSSRVRFGNSPCSNSNLSTSNSSRSNSNLSASNSSRSNSNLSASSTLLGTSYKMGHSRKDSVKSGHGISEHENQRSNTNISSSSSFLSFANESEDALTGEWSRESSVLSFANSTYSR
jgi:hypothetical protein